MSKYRELKILVVDDDVMVNNIAIMMLNKLGLQAEPCNSFDGAKRIIEAKGLYDIVMSGGGSYGVGHKFISWLSKLKPQTQIVCTSVYGIEQENKNPDGKAIISLPKPISLFKMTDVFMEILKSFELSDYKMKPSQELSTTHRRKNTNMLDAHPTG